MADIRDLFSVENENASSKDYSIMKKAVDESSGDLLGNIGKLFGGAVETVDNAIQNRAREDAVRARDSMDYEFGIVGASALEQDSSLPQSSPQEISLARENLSRFKTAVQQGKLDSSSYYLRADSVLRQLRAKYPGYRKEIDNIVSQEFGFDPANTVRQKLMADLDAAEQDNAANVGKMQTQFNGWVNSGNIMWGEDEAKLQQQLNSGQVDLDLYNKVQKKVSVRESIWKTKDLEDKITELDMKQKAKSLEQMVHQDFDLYLNNMLPPEYKDNLLGYVKQMRADGRLDEQEQAILAGIIQDMEISMRSNVDQLYSSPAYNTDNTPTNKMKGDYLPSRDPLYKIINEKVGFLKKLAFNDADISLAGMIDRDNAARKAHIENKMLVDPDINTARMQMDLWKDYSGTDRLKVNEKLGNIAQSVARKNLVYGQSPGTTMRLAVAEGLDDPKVLIDTIGELTGKGVADIVKDPVKHINGLLDSRDNILAPLNQRDRMKALRTMMTDDFINSVHKYGDDTTRALLPQFLSDSFRLVFKESVGDVGSLSRDDATGYQLQFDPKAGFKVVNESGAPGLTPLGVINPTTLMFQVGGYGNGLSEVNAFMQTYKKALGDQYTDEQKAEMTIAMLENTFQISTNPDAGGGFWYKAYQGIQNYLSGDKESKTDVNIEPASYSPDIEDSKALAEKYEGGKISTALLETASERIGMGEVPNRKELSQFLSDEKNTLDPATTAWCAAYVNAVLRENKIEGTGSNLARSFLNWGEEPENPAAGDLAIFQRGDKKWQGHVGFVKKIEADRVLVVGGNQGDSVSEKWYPKDKLLGYRRVASKQG